jgi:hypothetical protein
LGCVTFEPKEDLTDDQIREKLKKLTEL